MSNTEIQLSESVTLDNYELVDRFKRESGRVFLTGTQALIALLLLQRRMDDAAGLNTQGFVSGYRGSPLGAVDQTMWSQQKLLDKAGVKFLPAVNEELAASAVFGTQQVETEERRRVDGVYAMWYGKGCGVDRAGDALKHANAYGTSPHGGVLVIVGDDHGCVSSTMSHQSDIALASSYIPTLNPANIKDYLDFGLWGYAASRYSGLYVGFKAVSETVESACSVELPEFPQFNEPDDYDLPEGGVNLGDPGPPGMYVEERAEKKVQAIKAFARANPIDKLIFNLPEAKFGIVTSGKAYLDVMEALALLGIDKTRAAEIGIDVYKVGMVWPLENMGAEAFVTGKREVLVIEEKRNVIEDQLKSHCFNIAAEHRPERILGKYDDNGDPLIPGVLELSPSQLAPIIARRLSALLGDVGLNDKLVDIEACRQRVFTPKGVMRLPYFCSGCPHNSSTKVPEGSSVMGGTGCHYMTTWMEGRQPTDHILQMGGEGVNWLSKSLYVEQKHTFQNLGDGTYTHSGVMAIRQAAATSANITYKILFNDAVAMTGGQPLEGALHPHQIAAQLVAEGVKKVALVSDDVDRTRSYGAYPPSVSFWHRDDLDTLQRELRETPGVTALIYDQTCAAEKRRRRKRGEYPDPAKRVVINDLVCEGCGDCSIQSNCLSITPVETELGRKRKIDQSTCNKDYSCVNGFCPSFVTVEGGELKKGESGQLGDRLESLLKSMPQPESDKIERSYNILIGGIGGTGIVTVGAITSMAAHLEGKGASVQDYMGLAQKGGPVFSYVRLANRPEDLNQIRIDEGAANAVILCDLVVGNDARALRVMQENRTRAIANTAEVPTAAFVRDRTAEFNTPLLLNTVKSACGQDRVDTIDANAVALKLVGDTVYSNMLLLGFAWQRGVVPLSSEAIHRAIELNGRAIDQNKLAFDLGRAAAVNLDVVNDAAGLGDDVQVVRFETLEHIVDYRAEFLTKYQNSAYADQYRQFVGEVAGKVRSMKNGEDLCKAVARNLFKLMAYKDEYEVARLHTDGEMRKKIAEQFTGDYKLKFNMAPPIISRALDTQGRPKKKQFGSWMYGVLSVTAKLKFLRGSALDVFGYTAERKMERKLISDYKAVMSDFVSRINEENLPVAIEAAMLPDEIRGYGPVKEQAVEGAEEKLQKLKARFNDPKVSLKAEPYEVKLVK